MPYKTKLSIITVCYNNESDIEQTCLSVSNQTSSKFEWVVIDGNSNDGTKQILGQYKDKIATLISEKDKGIYDAMNKGIKYAKGEYVLFLNGGDRFADNKAVEKFLKSRPKKDVIYGDFHVEEPDKHVWVKKFPDKIDKYFFIEDCINHQSTFIKRSLFDKFGKYKLEYKIGADYEKWLHFLSKGVEFQHLPHIISVFKNYGGISTKPEMYQYKREEHWRIIRKYFTDKELLEWSREKINRLDQELLDIKATKFFRLWRKYDAIKVGILKSLGLVKGSTV